MSLIRPRLALEEVGCEHQEECRDFIDRISRRNSIRLKPYDLDKWGQGAASTLAQSNRSTKHPHLSDAGVSNVSQKVWGLLSTVPPRNFDGAFFELAFAIRGAHSPFMTFGRTQKFINMLCKYAYCYYWSGVDPAWNTMNRWVPRLSTCFHIPVDGVVLHNLRSEDRQWFLRLITTPVIQQGRKYARFRHGNERVGWGKLDRVYPYIAVQQYVLDHLNDACTPMHREMRDLWA